MGKLAIQAVIIYGVAFGGAIVLSKVVPEDSPVLTAVTGFGLTMAGLYIAQKYV